MYTTPPLRSRTGVHARSCPSRNGDLRSVGGRPPGLVRDLRGRRETGGAYAPPSYGRRAGPRMCTNAQVRRQRVAAGRGQVEHAPPPEAPPGVLEFLGDPLPLLLAAEHRDHARPLAL